MDNKKNVSSQQPFSKPFNTTSSPILTDWYAGGGFNPAFSGFFQVFDICTLGNIFDANLELISLTLHDNKNTKNITANAHGEEKE